MVTPLAVTMGEPGGIGAEITAKAWQVLSGGAQPCRPFFLIDSPERLEQAGIPVRAITTPAHAEAVFAEGLPVLDLGLPIPATPGRTSTDTARAVLASIEQAVTLCTGGQAAALVTNPIEKDVLIRSGFRFPGHTEYLAALTSAVPFRDEPVLPGRKERPRGPVMMMAGPALRTVPVTVHLSVLDAIRSLSVERIAHICRVTWSALHHDFGIDRPRLAVSGLNPHAGEGGHFGLEDRQMIAPAIELLRTDGIDIVGPLPADTLFHDAARARYDVAICMLHDQALIPVKTLDFDRTVNVTLGLPIIRTSPDHGTALDIAGKGVARPESLISALNLADEIATRREMAAA